MPNTYKSAPKTTRRATTRSAAMAALKTAIPEESPSTPVPSQAAVSKKLLPKVVVSKAAMSKATKNTPKSVASKAVTSKIVASKIIASKTVTSDTVASKKGLQKVDYERILDWLELKSNFEKCFGVSGQTSVGRGPSTSQSGWQALAELVNRESKGRLSIKPRAIKERFGRYKRKYCAVKTSFERTGFGVTEDDNTKGIYSIKAKLENMCPFFARMDQLFGGKPNVVPLGEICINRTVYTQGAADLDVGYNTCDDEDFIEDGGKQDESFESANKEDDSSDHEGDKIHDRPHHDLYTLASVTADRLDQETPPLDSSDFNGDGSADEGDISEMLTEKPRKRHQSDAGMAAPTKRSRATDTRKAPPKLSAGPAQPSRSGFAAAFTESSTAKIEGKENFSGDFSFSFSFT